MTPTEYCGEVRGLLLWARENRFAVSRVKVGDVELDIVADLSLAAPAPSIASDQPTQDPYETYGSAALERLRRQTESDGDVVIDDDEV